MSVAQLAAHLVEPGIKGEDVCVGREGGGEGGEGEMGGKGGEGHK